MNHQRERSGIGPPGSEEVAAQLQHQLAVNPGDLLAMHNLSVELRLLGRSADALDLADRAWSAGLHLPETATARGHALIDLGRFANAAEAFRDAIAIDPTHTPSHEALATLLPQISPHDDALSAYELALARTPDTVALWSSALTAANAQKRFDRLAEWSERAIRRFGDDPVLAGFAACALLGKGRAEEARARISAALVRAPHYVHGQLILARVLISLGDAGGAALAAEAAVRLDRHNQLAWTLLGTAWQMLGDPRAEWLFDYEHLVMQLAVDMPVGIAEVLAGMHRAGLSPAEQSLRGGTQTAGNLFHSPDPTVQDLAKRLLSAIEHRLGALPHDAEHPFLSRNSGQIAYSASWSVRLAGQGFHVSHMHPAGWLSSALYVALPDCVKARSGEGALTFGVPDGALGLSFSARRIVHPREGELVLFPSYFWHGTTPFHSDEPRLTVAFDALPLGDGTR